MSTTVEVFPTNEDAGDVRCVGRHDMPAHLDIDTWTSTSPCHGARAVVEVADLDPLTYAIVTSCGRCSALWEISFPLGGPDSNAMALWIG